QFLRLEGRREKREQEARREERRQHRRHHPAEIKDHSPEEKDCGGGYFRRKHYPFFRFKMCKLYPDFSFFEKSGYNRFP
ncbi:hypothetical protein KKF55_06730, partial [Patescibacteria group bacterium]|nr:hypothetical protein [Patescibacteria group bacterium]